MKKMLLGLLVVSLLLLAGCGQKNVLVGRVDCGTCVTVKQNCFSLELTELGQKKGNQQLNFPEVECNSSMVAGYEYKCVEYENKNKECEVDDWTE